MSILCVVVRVLCIQYMPQNCYLALLGQGLVFFGEDRLANAVVQFSKIRSCKPDSPGSPAAHLCSTAHIQRDISAA